MARFQVSLAGRESALRAASKAIPPRRNVRPQRRAPGRTASKAMAFGEARQNYRTRHLEAPHPSLSANDGAMPPRLRSKGSPAGGGHAAARSRHALTITDPHGLTDKIAAARAHGWAIAPRETSSALNAVAAPILDSHGRHLATLAVLAPFEPRCSSAGGLQILNGYPRLHRGRDGADAPTRPLKIGAGSLRARRTGLQVKDGCAVLSSEAWQTG